MVTSSGVASNMACNADRKNVKFVENPGKLIFFRLAVAAD